MSGQIILPDSVTAADKEREQDTRQRVCLALIASDKCNPWDVVDNATAIIAYITGKTDTATESE